MPRYVNVILNLTCQVEHVIVDDMEENRFESFDKLDENELSLVLDQVARRMMMLRTSTPDAAFWYGVLRRVGKWLSTEPVVNEVEKNLLFSPPTNLNGRTRAIKSMRERSGANMAACIEIVDKWVLDHLDEVDAAVRNSFLSNTKNVAAARAKGWVYTP